MHSDSLQRVDGIRIPVDTDMEVTDTLETVCLRQK
jgi:hypothetical protein